MKTYEEVLLIEHKSTEEKVNGAGEEDKISCQRVILANNKAVKFGEEWEGKGKRTKAQFLFEFRKTRLNQLLILFSDFLKERGCFKTHEAVDKLTPLTRKAFGKISGGYNQGIGLSS